MTMTADPSIAARVCSPSDLAAHERDEMFELFCRHFDQVNRQQFEHDLSEKNVVLTLRERTGALRGFSTMLVYQAQTPEGSPLSVVYSGDTIVDPSAWNSTALPREWIAAVKRLRISFPMGPYYWLLITSGFRTYRLLSTFWCTFYPRYDAPTPPDQQRVLDELARAQFGGAYDANAGIVRFARPQVLRPHLAGVPQSRLDDPHVSFFAQRNPGYLRGDELACLCELADSNLTRAGRRMVFGAEARQP
jgi:hypothetical protein